MDIIVACGEVTDEECEYLSDAMARHGLNTRIVRVPNLAYESSMFTSAEHDVRSEMNDEDSALWLEACVRELANLIFSDDISITKVKAVILPKTPERGHPQGEPYTWLTELFPEDTPRYEVCTADEPGYPSWLKSVGNHTNYGNALPPTSNILF